MKNEICILVKDLIPSYIDGVCSEDSIEIIEKHLAECEECKAMYESMKANFMSDLSDSSDSDYSLDNNASQTDSGIKTSSESGMTNGSNNYSNGSDEYDKELLKRVSEKVKKRENKIRMTSIISAAAAIVLILGVFLPIIPVSPKKLDVTVTENSQGEFIIGSENLSMEELNKRENMVFVYDDESIAQKNVDELKFDLLYAQNLPRDTNFAVAEDFNPNEITVVNIKSNYLIKGYSYKVKESAEGKKLIFSSFRTSLAGLILSNEDTEFSTTVVNFDGVNDVIFK